MSAWNGCLTGNRAIIIMIAPYNLSADIGNDYRAVLCFGTHLALAQLTPWPFGIQQWA